MKRVSANHKTEEIMTISALGRYLRCNRHTLYRLLKERKIPAFRVGSDWRFSRSAIDDWIAAHRVAERPLLEAGGRT